MPLPAAPTKCMAVLKVEVVLALPDASQCVSLELPSGSTVEDALTAAALELPDNFRLGVFGKVVPISTPLHDGDRVEIYRPLAIDPKEARRQRARQNRR